MKKDVQFKSYEEFFAKWQEILENDQYSLGVKHKTYMRKSKNWIKLLTQEHQELVRINAEPSLANDPGIWSTSMEERVAGIGEAISSLFLFHETPQGYAFWYHIIESFNLGTYNTTHFRSHSQALLASTKNKQVLETA